MLPDPSTRGWNPRFANFARCHGRTPVEQLEHDSAEWPCASTIPYREWNTARLREFRAMRPDCFTSGGLSDHAAYDAWLATLPVGHGAEAYPRRNAGAAA